MKLTDLQSCEKWIELEKEINRRSGLQASVFDTDGIRITDYKSWANRLCPEIKATDRGQSYICAVAHQNLAVQAQQTRRPVVEECDAGLAKVVVPIFVGEEFIGAAGGCGLLLDQGEVDNFMVNKTTEIDTAKLESLSQDIGRITLARAEELAAFIEGEIGRIISEYQGDD